MAEDFCDISNGNIAGHIVDADGNFSLPVTKQRLSE